MGQKIMIVDDEPDILKVLVARLKEHGFITVTATEGTEALDLAEVERPDLIVLDIMMPGMDGTEVAQRLKDNPKTQHIPIIFISALQTKENEESDMGGGSIILAKPFEIDVLLDKIRQFTSGDANESSGF